MWVTNIEIKRHYYELTFIREIRDITKTVIKKKCPQEKTRHNFMRVWQSLITINEMTNYFLPINDTLWFEKIVSDPVDNLSEIFFQVFCVKQIRGTEGPVRSVHAICVEAKTFVDIKNLLGLDSVPSSAEVLQIKGKAWDAMVQIKNFVNLHDRGG